jgi:hypothetical protein
MTVEKVHYVDISQHTTLLNVTPGGLCGFGRQARIYEEQRAKLHAELTS